jgi:flagellar basal-body rod modification protein FlgD
MITGIGATDPTATTATAAAGSGLGALDSDAFLKLMVAQLRYQNPLEPTDASQMMAQTAAFTQVETLQKLAASQQTMLGMQEALMATGLVGSQIQAMRVDETILQGTVDGVRFTPEGPLLSVDGEEVALAAVIHVGVGAAGAGGPADGASNEGTASSNDEAPVSGSQSEQTPTAPDAGAGTGITA